MKSFLTPLALLLLAAPAFAQTQADTDKRIADLEKKVALLSKSESKDDDLKGAGFNVKFTGRVFLDGTYFSGGNYKLTNGAFLRVARLGWKATLGNNWYGEGELDFSLNAIGVKDMWAGYTGFKDTLIQVGHFKEPFGMDTLMSDSNIFCMERSFTDSWTPSRHIGVGVAKWGERWQGKVAFFGQAIDDTSDAQEVADTPAQDPTAVQTAGKAFPKLVTYKITDNQGWGAAARFTFLPVAVADNKFVHLGLAVAQRMPNAGAPGDYTWDFSCRPGTNKQSKAKFLNAAVTNVDKLSQTGAEFAGQWGNLSWQSEYQQSQVKRRDTQMLVWNGVSQVATTAAVQLASTVDHKFSTYYGQVAYVFGGQRRYDNGDAFFKGVTPNGKNGAWEIVARYNVMNQDDKTAIDPVLGGIEKNTTLGLNYYVNKYLRFMLNYTTVKNNENAMASKAYSATGAKIPSDNFNYTNMRVAVTF